MKLYEITCSEYFEAYNILDSNYKLNRKFDGIEKMSDEWGVKTLQKIHKGKKADIAYNWSFNGSLILKEHAYEILKNIFLDDEVEMLPVAYENERCYIPHCITAVSNMNIEIQKRKDESHYYYFSENELKNNRLYNKYFFKAELNHGVVTNMLFTERFINLVSEHNLKGIEFDEAGGTETE